LHAEVKTIHRTYHCALYPTKSQEVLLNQHFGCVRWVYNYFLNQRIAQYRETGKSDNYYKHATDLTNLKRKEETVWLGKVNSQSLQAAIKHLDKAYENFYGGRTQFPRFKTKKGKNSFSVPQYVKVIGDRLYIQKFKEGLKLMLHRPIEGKIKHCTVSKTPTGKYFVSILCEVQYHPKPKTSKAVGIDLGVKDFAVTSDGARFQNPKYLKRYEKKLKTAQRHLAKKQKGSGNRSKQHLKVARLHEKIANTRKDHLHKLSTQITNAYDVICVEGLNVQGMLKNKKLSKHISDASWSTFVRFLQYKAGWNDKQLVKVGRFYPSSKTCSECGLVNPDLTLSARQWTCPNGHVLDRDINASKNILQEGLNILSGGTPDYTCGGLGKTS
jgi:putative transposase